MITIVVPKILSFLGAGVPLTSGQLYSAGHTDDLRQSLMYIKNTYPNAPLLGLGFSLGANVIVRYLGEEGHNSLLSTGCVLACVRIIKMLKILTLIGIQIFEAMGSNGKQ